jgi:hypothetical protein
VHREGGLASEPARAGRLSDEASRDDRAAPGGATESRTCCAQAAICRPAALPTRAYLAGGVSSVWKPWLGTPDHQRANLVREQPQIDDATAGGGIRLASGLVHDRDIQSHEAELGAIRIEPLVQIAERVPVGCPSRVVDAEPEVAVLCASSRTAIAVSTSSPGHGPQPLAIPTQSVTSATYFVGAPAAAARIVATSSGVCGATWPA